jgi:hypothetical protein
MTDISNDPLHYDGHLLRNANGLIASTGIIHDRIVKVTQSVIESFR